MLKIFFRFPFLLFILIFSKCRENQACDMDQFNNYINISDSEMKSYNGINNLVIKHFKDLTQSYYNEDGVMLNLTPFEIRKVMLSDTLEFDKYLKIYKPFSKYPNVSSIAINVKDTTLDYEISMNMCMGKKDMIIWHRLVYSTSNKTIDHKNRGQILIKQKPIAQYWTYLVKNEEYLGR